MENPLIRIEPGLFIWTVITFLVLLGLLAKFVWKPLMEALDRRENRIRKSLEDAEKAREDLERLHLKSEEIIAKARTEAQSILVDGKEAAERIKEDVLQDAKQKADSISSNAEKQILAEKDKAILEIKNEVVDIALQVATKLISKNITKEDNLSLIEEAMKNVDTIHEA